MALDRALVSAGTFATLRVGGEHGPGVFTVIAVQFEAG